MRRIFLSGRLRAGGLPLALAAGLALTASACMAPSAKKSSAAGEQATTAGSGQQSGAQGGKEAKGRKSGGKELSWWQKLRRYHQEPKEKPWVYGDVRPGRGLLSNDEDGYTLYRQGEAGSSDPDKPTKVRR